MKKLILLFIILFLTTDLIISQTDTTKFKKKYHRDTTDYKEGWTPLGTIGLGISQVSLSNWTRGGENLISITGNSDFYAIYFGKPWLLKNNLSASIGTTKTGSGNFQTNDNAALLENVLIYKATKTVNPFVSNEVRSGVLNGYDYNIDPIVQTSAFFDPGYITQSFGAIFDRPIFSSRIGIAFQETFANKFRQYTDDINTTDVSEAFKFQTGIESVTTANFVVAENLLYNSRLRLFSAFDQLDVWDVAWDNTIAAKINSFLTTTLDILVVYEKSQTPKTQLKEGLQLGINYTVF